MRVAVHGQVSELGRRILERELCPPRFEVTFVGPDDPGRAEALAGCEALIVDHAPLTDADFDAMPRLRLVQRLGRGPFDISGEIAAAQARGIPFAHNRSGFAARATAEHTVMVMLALLRGLPGTHEYVRDGGWRGTNRFDAVTRELAGAAVGLVGMGRVAAHVARLLAPFGVTTRYWSRRRLPAPREAELATGFRPLPELLAESDIVSLHVRANSAAEFRFGAAEFARMRPGGYFVNTARGVLVDETALAKAIGDGRLAGAAVDVFATEPPPGDSPLLGLPGVILTPHIAGRTRDVAESYYLCACANLGRLRRGEPLADLIAPQPREVPH